MIKNRVSAFTLAELLVVLVISSIVIALGFSVLNMVRKQVFLIQKNYRKKQTVQTFESVLKRDFNKGIAKYDSNLDRLIISSNKNDVVYQFLKGIIIREEDTLELLIGKKSFYLDGAKVTSGFIDAVELQFDESFSSKQIFLYQKKDAAYYLNSN
jgi:prepilin-type N-terminal cleavage/methylation domain-containing protein